MQRPMQLVLAALLALAVVTTAARAAEETSPEAGLLTAGFLYAHPDLKHRFRGLELYEQGKSEQAFAEFRRAAHWADKFAQAMVAEMLWTGDGVRADRAEAYAWMDLAAERGYPTLLALRERYWADLGPGERKRALQVGQGIYAEYGDAVAMRRLETRLTQEHRRMTGSRIGFVGPLQVMVPHEGIWRTLSGEEYFDSRYWEPEEYFAWQDRIGQLPPRGVVRVGPLSNRIDSPQSDATNGN